MVCSCTAGFYTTIILWAIPLPNIIFEFLTLITKGPGWLLFTTVIFTLGTSPIEASRLFKLLPASMPTNFTVSPARTFDNGLAFSCSIAVSSLT